MLIFHKLINFIYLFHSGFSHARKDEQSSGIKSFPYVYLIKIWGILTPNPTTCRYCSGTFPFDVTRHGGLLNCKNSLHKVVYNFDHPMTYFYDIFLSYSTRAHFCRNISLTPLFVDNRKPMWYYHFALKHSIVSSSHHSADTSLLQWKTWVLCTIYTLSADRYHPTQI